MGKHIKEMAVILLAVVMFLYMVFAWAVIYVLIVAKQAWFIPAAIALWFVDVWALDKLTKYENKKWGVGRE